MVTVRIVVEGGVLSCNAEATTASNTESLRQSLHSFFTRLLSRDDISIVISLGAGYRSAVKRFQKEAAGTSLFVDLDAQKSKVNEWFVKLETENKDKQIILSPEQKENVFFMVQEMEAWFLKQPNCFEKWAKLEKYNKRDEKSIADHNLISGKNIEDISKPSAVVAILLKHFFEKRIDGKKRKLAVYGKLRTAPVLLDCLDVALLETQDSELVRFKNIMNKNFI